MEYFDTKLKIAIDGLHWCARLRVGTSLGSSQSDRHAVAGLAAFFLGSILKLPKESAEMECCEFEPKIQVECAIEILRILRGGDAIAQKGDLLEHAGCLIGGVGAYLNSLEDPAIYGAAAHDLPCNLDECCDEVEASLEGVSATAINPALLALLLRLAELLLNKYLS